MDLNRFTEKMQEALQSAQSRAIRRSHQQLDVEHLLAALVEQESGLAGAILAKAGASAELLGGRLEQELDRISKVNRPDRCAAGPELRRRPTQPRTLSGGLRSHEAQSNICIRRACHVR